MRVKQPHIPAHELNPIVKDMFIRERRLRNARREIRKARATYLVIAGCLIMMYVIWHLLTK